ncbi:hypothetical protein OBBRIDRAFT_832205 [Obba rivulosa]|uniref:Uncharacterized protein n=1 Tax=Obba rivulosa TaxID=1052685 RepID=A0A8E2DQN4_9APHY|nr:hypothetical protein OBBRIDRAFT_832205 [Obba rivulosa]
MTKRGTHRVRDPATAAPLRTSGCPEHIPEARRLGLRVFGQCLAAFIPDFVPSQAEHRTEPCAPRRVSHPKRCCLPAARWIRSGVGAAVHGGRARFAVGIVPQRRTRGCARPRGLGTKDSEAEYKRHPPLFRTATASLQVIDPPGSAQHARWRWRCGGRPPLGPAPRAGGRRELAGPLQVLPTRSQHAPPVHPRSSAPFLLLLYATPFEPARLRARTRHRAFLKRPRTHTRPPVQRSAPCSITSPAAHAP